MQCKKPLMTVRKRNKESGITLLEYSAGAAMLLAVVMGAVWGFGGSISGLFTNLSAWVDDRAGEISAPTGGGQGGGGTP